MLWREETARKVDIPHTPSLEKRSDAASGQTGTQACTGQSDPLARRSPRSLINWWAGSDKALTDPDTRYTQLPPKPRRLAGRKQDCFRQLRAAVAAKSEELAIPAMHLARKSDLEKLARQPDRTDVQCMRGWRKEIIGRDLAQICRQKC